MIKSMIEKAKNIILPISGGIGRNIFATAVIKNLKKAYPSKNIFVVAGFPDIFMNNPNVKKIFGFNSVQHLYEDYLDKYSSDGKNNETVLIEVEPYRHPEYLNSNMHIVEAWCDMLGIPCIDTLPDIFLSRVEVEMAKSHVLALEQKFSRPVILLQHTGGKVPDNNNKQDQIVSMSVMHRRSLSEKCTQELTTKLIADGYTVASVQSPNQFCPTGAERINAPIRVVFGLIPNVKGVIAIDSFLQHASAGLGVQSLVLWAGTSPDRLGYKMHKNLRRNVCDMPECHRPNSYAFDINANGFTWDCPFQDRCTDYDANTIIDAYKEMKGEDYVDTVKNFKKIESLLEVKQPEKTSTACPVHKH